MLPAFVIEELLKIQREEGYALEIFIDLPESGCPPMLVPKRPTNEPEEKDRGVAIIDFTI